MPLMVFGLIGGADLARAYALQLAVQNGARAGAESYAIDQSKDANQAIQRTRDEISRTPGFVKDGFGEIVGLHVEVSVSNSEGSTCNATGPTVLEPCFVTVRVQYTFRTLVPWPLVPNVASLDRSTTMRTFY
jgi:Flp pilus assembly protein TadG